MSKTRKRVTVDEGSIEKRPKTRRCESCGVAFAEEDVEQDRDSLGRPLGWFCGGCI